MTHKNDSEVQQSDWEVLVGGKITGFFLHTFERPSTEPTKV